MQIFPYLLPIFANSDYSLMFSIIRLLLHSPFDIFRLHVSPFIRQPFSEIFTFYISSVLILEDASFFVRQKNYTQIYMGAITTRILDILCQHGTDKHFHHSNYDFTTNTDLVSLISCLKICKHCLFNSHA